MVSSIGFQIFFFFVEAFKMKCIIAVHLMR